MNTNNTNQCLRCMKIFPNRSRLVRHINGARTCKISILGGQDLTKIQLLQGLEQQKQSQIVIHKCNKCGKVFDRQCKLEKHEINCQGDHDFITQKLILNDTHREYKKLKYYIRAVFYSTYIDTNIKFFKRVGTLYHIYEEGKWSKNRYSKFSVITKIFNRLRRKIDNNYINKKARDICEYYYSKYITSEKELKLLEKNADRDLYCGKFFYRMFMDDILKVIEDGKYTNIYGFINYNKYKEDIKKQYAKDQIQYEADLLNDKRKEHNIKMKKIAREKEKEQSKQRQKLIELDLLWQDNYKDFFEGIKHLIKYKYDINDNDQKDECFAEISVLIHEWDSDISIVLQIYDYFNENFEDISFYSIFKKYDFIC